MACIVFNHSEVQYAIERTAAASAEARKMVRHSHWQLETAQKMIDRDARMITCGADHVLLVQGFQKAFQAFSELKVK